MKISNERVGIEPATFQFVAQHLNHCATAVRWQQYSTHLRTNNTQNDTKQNTEQHNKLEECGPCPIFAGFTLAFALHVRKKHGKTSIRKLVRYAIELVFLRLRFSASAVYARQRTTVSNRERTVNGAT